MPVIDAIAAGVMLVATLGVVAARASRARHTYRMTRQTADLLGEAVRMLERERAGRPEHTEAEDAGRSGAVDRATTERPGDDVEGR